jgi:hypothetical protein
VLEERVHRTAYRPPKRPRSEKHLHEIVL